MIWCYIPFGVISLLSKHIVLNSSWKGRPFILKTPSFVVLRSITPVFCGPILCLCLCLWPHFVLLFVAPLCVVNLLFKRQFMQLLCKAYCVDRPQSLSTTTNVEISIFWISVSILYILNFLSDVYYTLYKYSLSLFSGLMIAPFHASMIDPLCWVNLRSLQHIFQILKQMIQFRQP